MRELREVVYVDGVRTAFGRVGPTGMFRRPCSDGLTALCTGMGMGAAIVWENLVARD